MSLPIKNSYVASVRRDVAQYQTARRPTSLRRRPSLMHMEAGSGRRRKVTRHFAGVTKGYLSHGRRGCVKRHEAAAAEKFPSLALLLDPFFLGALLAARRAPPVGMKLNSIFDYAGFAYFPHASEARTTVNA